MPTKSWAPSPGHIVRAEVPFSDSEGWKTRFPVVVSAHSFNENHTEIIVAFATRSANVRQPRDYDVEISDRHSRFSHTGLTESTTVRCGRLWTISKQKISACVGVVPDDLLVDIERLVRACFHEA
jgi:mRNA-degrading endonuclease toxin of MazEF toxin-antitoxin module